MNLKIAGSTSYPAGTGADIGMDATAANPGRTFSLFECGIIVAYIPNAGGVGAPKRSLMGVGI